ncbi:MAG: HAD family hydrolase [Corynebacteriales bacterium]|nr:HAD family hydrolase [Mycobacteriales bacterium]
MSRTFPTPDQAAFVFDLDGTLVDSVYQHVISWQEALRDVGIELSVWRIHRKIGMSGGLFMQGVLRELREAGREFTDQEVEQLHNLHASHYLPRVPEIQPLPGARELLAHLSEAGIPWSIATSGRRVGAAPMLEKLEVDPQHPMVTRDEVKRAKPDPDLFLAGAAVLDMAPSNCIVVGDSIWDMLAARRAGALGVGLLSGGYGENELERAHAFRVYADPWDLLSHLDELGIRAER